MERASSSAQKNRSEATSRSQARSAERRLAEANTAAALARGEVEALQQLRVALAPTGIPSHRQVLTVASVAAGYSRDCPVIRDASLEIVGPERIAIVGPNGSGKSTLLRLLLGGLKAWSGEVAVHVPFALLDQQVSLLEPQATVLDNFRRLNPTEGDGACRSALARFEFRAGAAQELAQI